MTSFFVASVLGCSTGEDGGRGGAELWPARRVDLSGLPTTLGRAPTTGSSSSWLLAALFGEP